MGVPHLAKQLHPFAEFAPLGCKSTGCKEHPSDKKLVIDGPSLAYHIYQRGLAHSPASLGPMDAIPSNEWLGNATLAFLDELQCHGTTVENIYFDGAISKDREEIRKSRLEASLKQLNFAHGTYLNGFKVSKEIATIAPINRAEILGFACSLPPDRKVLLPPAFLVPAVLDSLRTSAYAPITSLVPGEADLFCARAALKSNCTILTNDSDLLLYDLGVSSEVVFFNQIVTRNTHETSSDCAVLYAFVSQPSKIASRLGLRDLRRLAFEIREDRSINLRNAVVRAKQSSASFAPESPSIRQTNFKNFENQYDTKLSDFEAITRAGMTFGTDVSHGYFLDPRLSELVSRCPYPSSMFLPVLTDDPSRSSAWGVSQGLRYLTYSCLLFKNSDTVLEQVLEFVRRGARTVRDDVRLLSCDETIHHAKLLAQKLENFKSFLAKFSKQAIWRPYALCEVLGWYAECGKQLPSKDILMTVFLGTTKNEQLSWNEVHISAQLQAVLYSLRMLQQILVHLMIHTQETIETDKLVRKGTLTETFSWFSAPPEFRYKHPKQLPPEFLALEQLLRSLPLLAELIPSRLELTATPSVQAAEFGRFLDTIISYVQTYSEDSEEESIESKEGGKAKPSSAIKNLDESSSEIKEPGEETQAIGMKRSENQNDGRDGQDKNNPFHVLGSE